MSPENIEAIDLFESERTYQRPLDSGYYYAIYISLSKHPVTFPHNNQGIPPFCVTAFVY